MAVQSESLLLLFEYGDYIPLSKMIITPILMNVKMGELRYDYI